MTREIGIWRAGARRSGTLSRALPRLALLLVLTMVLTVLTTSPARAQVGEAGGGGFEQLGGDIDGLQPEIFFGHDSAMNDAGDVVIVTALDTGSSSAIRVLAWDGTSWVQRGVITTAQRTRLVPLAVAMSADGNTVAVGAQRNTRRGQVEILDWNGSSWVTRGEPLVGPVGGRQFGAGLAMTADGNTVVVGAREGSPGQGSIKVFDWQGTSWIQRGDAFETEDGDELGATVAVSEDGNVVLSANTDTDLGISRIYVWDGTAWTQRGADIRGTADRGGLGWSGDLSASGDSVVLGDLFVGVRILDWNGTAWTQRGADITGGFGDSVAMSSDGNTIVAGAALDNNANGNEAGQAGIFGWDGTAWVQQAGIFGEQARDESGTTVSMSASGDTIVVGAPRNDGNGKSSGHARVFRLADPCDAAACSLNDGDVVFLQNVSTGRYLDGDGVTSAFNVDTSPTPKFDDRWRLDSNTDGTWSLSNRRHNRFLDADGRFLDWNVGQSAVLGADDRWEIVSSGPDQYVLRNTFYDRYLSEDATGNVVTVAEADINDAARWQLSPAS